MVGGGSTEMLFDLGVFSIDAVREKGCVAANGCRLFSWLCIPTISSTQIPKNYACVWRSVDLGNG